MREEYTDKSSENKRRVGRPTDNPKIHRSQAKLDEETLSILSAYCEQERITESEAIRRGIQRLNAEIKRK